IQGGGVYVNTSSATLNASGGQIASNTAGSEGGGVFVDQGSATLSRTPVVSNTADIGGGLYNSEGTLNLVNVTVSHNVATAGDGGGLYSEIGT
ncbi:MAG: right-handed parallel beta-helix repeat-containing protein, partial [Anaerolineae bacterium]|nr:right-handed parallel beta-helix repeat-containing protein [Anaerolineae bacterium]